MDDYLPLSALLSQVWVAFTIEFDNEFEHLVPHRTTNYGSVGAPQLVPWLVSMTMWLQFMRFVPDEGIDAKELCHLTELSTKTFRRWLIRMSKWWNYVTVSQRFVRPTPGGRKALEAWRPLNGVIEKRWQERFGKHRIDQLREVMHSLVQRFGVEYPDHLPILGYEFLSEVAVVRSLSANASRGISGNTLPALLSQVLLAFATEFERESGLSLALSANLLRLAGDKGVRVRDLQRLSGVSKEAITMCLRRAEECGLGIVRGESYGSRIKSFVLTSKGENAQDTYHEQVRKIEKRWATDFGKDNVQKLRKALEQLVGKQASEVSPLFEGLKPYPEGWRASVAAPEHLPHYPMVLHRGGFPDGS
jgi:DNA-binding MarR family transcriptional regulator